MAPGDLSGSRQTQIIMCEVSCALRQGSVTAGNA
jgi:hypothetical protein